MCKLKPASPRPDSSKPQRQITDQISSTLHHQHQRQHRHIVTLSFIMLTMALDSIYSIFSFIFSLTLFFQDMETNIFLMLGLSPSTAFRMFPPLAQFLVHSTNIYITGIYLSCILCFLLYSSIASLLLSPESFSDFDPYCGLLTTYYRRVAGNNRVQNFCFSVIRYWLHASSLNFVAFHHYHDENLLLFIVKTHVLSELF